eukprot:5630594-Alexandrium_andersonii.AAC.1
MDRRPASEVTSHCATPSGRAAPAPPSLVVRTLVQQSRRPASCSWALQLLFGCFGNAPCASAEQLTDASR